MTQPPPADAATSTEYLAVFRLIEHAVLFLILCCCLLSSVLLGVAWQICTPGPAPAIIDGAQPTRTTSTFRGSEAVTIATQTYVIDRPFATVRAHYAHELQRWCTPDTLQATDLPSSESPPAQYAATCVLRFRHQRPDATPEQTFAVHLTALTPTRTSVIQEETFITDC